MDTRTKNKIQQLQFNITRRKFKIINTIEGYFVGNYNLLPNWDLRGDYASDPVIMKLSGLIDKYATHKYNPNKKREIYCNYPICDLSIKEIEILDLRFKKNYSYEKLSQLYFITISEVKQIEDEALRKMVVDKTVDKLLDTPNGVCNDTVV